MEESKDLKMYKDKVCVNLIEIMVDVDFLQGVFIRRLRLKVGGRKYLMA